MKDLIFYQEKNGDYFCIDPSSKKSDDLGEWFNGKIATIKHLPESIVPISINSNAVISSNEIPKAQVPYNWLKMFL